MCVMISVRWKLWTHSLDSDNPNEVKIEQVWCSLKIGEERILVGCIYKEPKTSREEVLQIFESVRVANGLIDKGV